MDFGLSEEHKALVETARRFSRERIAPVAAECDRDSKFPMDVFKAAWEIGLVNPCIPEEYGGAGMGELENALLTEQMAYGCTGIQTSITANQLALTPIKLGGSDEQKKKYLGMLASEPVMASYATSEPDAGSDVAGPQDASSRSTATTTSSTGRSAGSRTPATRASTWSSRPATRPRATRASRRSSSIATRPGSASARRKTSSASAPATPRRSSSRTWWSRRRTSSRPRARASSSRWRPSTRRAPTSPPARRASCSAALDESSAYAKERKTFGTAIGQHQLVQWMLAEMAIRIEATRLLYMKAGWCLDNGVRDPMTSSIAKAYGADSAMQTAVDAVQVFGGNGYVKEYPVEKLMRDAKVLQIYEGTSQIQRLVIAKQMLSG
jgi:acyl-CoA dehydrogenase